MPLKVSQLPSLTPPQPKLEPLTEEHLNSGPVLVCVGNLGKQVFLATRAARIYSGGQLIPWTRGPVAADILVLEDRCPAELGRTYFGQHIAPYRVLPPDRKITVTISSSKRTGEVRKRGVKATPETKCSR